MESKINRDEVRRRIRHRIRHRLSGTAEKPRLAVFRSDKHIYAQVVDDVAGRTLAHASSRDAAAPAAMPASASTRSSAAKSDCRITRLPAITSSMPVSKWRW